MENVLFHPSASEVSVLVVLIRYNSALYSYYFVLYCINIFPVILLINNYYLLSKL